MSMNQTRAPTPVGKASFRDAMGLFATGVAVLTTAHQGRHQSPGAKRTNGASPSEGHRADSDLARDLGFDGIRHGNRNAASHTAKHDAGAADTPDGPKTDDDAYFAEDDTWIE